MLFYFDARLCKDNVCPNYAPACRLTPAPIATLTGTLCVHESMRTCLKDLGGPMVRIVCIGGLTFDVH